MDATSNKPTLEQRTEEFRALVHQAIRKADAAGKTVKPYEGTVSLHWPATVHTSSHQRRYTLRLSCSVLGGPTSHYSWSASSWKSVFACATRDVEQWIAELDNEVQS